MARPRRSFFCTAGALSILVRTDVPGARGLSRGARRAIAEAEAARWTIRVPTVALMEIVLLE